MTDDGERMLALLAYGLLMIAPAAGGVSALAGVAIACVRLKPAGGGRYESHYRNQIRVFLVLLVFAVAMLLFLATWMGMALALPGVFAFAWPLWEVGHVAAWVTLLPILGLLSLAMGVWYYWRLVRGFVRALDARAC